MPVGALVAFLKESPLHLGAATLSLVLAYHSIARREYTWLRISPAILSVGHCVRTERMDRVGRLDAGAEAWDAGDGILAAVWG